MNQIIMWIMAVGAVLGGVDRIAGNRFGLGKRFEEGFTLLGPTALSMSGIICLTPLLSRFLRFALVPIWNFLGLDAGLLAGILAIDMGGYQLAGELSASQEMVRYAGLVIAATLGCTITFTIPELAENSAVCVPTMMPYITAFFMPRRKGDRPDVIPDGCVNFAFLGQFAETPRDTIFTTEYSVRTAMEAVYGLLGVDRGVPEVWGSVYDIRDLLDSSVKLMDGKSPLEIELPGPLNLLKKPLLKLVDGNVVGDLLKEHGIIKEDMVK